VKQEFQRDLPPLWLDANKIEQVFVNVFMNAIEAMPDEGTLTVRTYSKQLDAGEAVRSDGAWTNGHFLTGSQVVMAEIEDTGTGIPEDKLEKIFDPFYSTREPGQAAGLGLTVAKKIVEMHSGKISVNNREEHGVRVTMMFKA